MTTKEKLLKKGQVLSRSSDISEVFAWAGLVVAVTSLVCIYRAMWFVDNFDAEADIEIRGAVACLIGVVFALISLGAMYLFDHLSKMYYCKSLNLNQKEN